MKLVMVSDTHELHLALEGFLPEGDVFIHAGDFSMQGEPLYVEKFNEWLGTLPYKHKLVIPGNHELTFDEKFNPDYYTEMRARITNATLLVNQSAVIDGVKFYGMPDTPEFMNWGFNRNQAEIPPYVEAIPADTDVLITHGPPFGILDDVYERTRDRQTGVPFTNLVHVGCKELLVRVKKIKPKVHVFGHIHGSRGECFLDGTQFFNASIVNERYRPTYPPQEIEI